MAIEVTCDECFSEYKVKDQAAGKRIRCKECDAKISVPKRSSKKKKPSAFDELDDDGDSSRGLPPRRSQSGQKSGSTQRRGAGGASAVFSLGVFTVPAAIMAGLLVFVLLGFVSRFFASMFVGIGSMCVFCYFVFGVIKLGAMEIEVSGGDRVIRSAFLGGVILMIILPIVIIAFAANSLAEIHWDRLFEWAFFKRLLVLGVLGAIGGAVVALILPSLFRAIASGHRPSQMGWARLLCAIVIGIFVSAMSPTMRSQAREMSTSGMPSRSETSTRGPTSVEEARKRHRRIVQDMEQGRSLQSSRDAASIVLTNVSDQNVAKIMSRLTKLSKGRIVDSRRDFGKGQHVFQVAPVADLQALADGIDFGQVTKVDAQQNLIEVRLE